MTEERKKIQLTQEALTRLRQELAHLEGDARESIISEIATARAHGDLSENAEYHAAKDQQGLQEARVRQLRDMIENAEIVEVSDDGIVRPGMVVTIRYEGEDPETYLIGVREERGGEHDVLTPESPLGRALLGKTAGEAISTKVPSGEMKVEILEVRAP